MRETASYWDGFYGARSGGDMALPSQFAVFVAGEIRKNIATVVDIGCGDGKDSLFFARHGFQVTGIDSARSAIDLCLAGASGLDAEFICSEVENTDLAERIRSRIGDRPAVLYSRFFLHAIDENAEGALLALAESVCSASCIFAVEFRTTRDRQQTKETGDHYRRFIDPLAFADRARAHHFVPRYFVEGFGYAKYRSDDAHVARMLLQRVS